MDEILSLPQTMSLKIEEIRRDNPDAEEIITDLYLKLRSPLVSYVYQLIGTTRDAEDLVQIAFLQLFDQLIEKAEIQNVRGWLYRVVHNLALDYVKQIDRRNTLFKRWFMNDERVIDRRTAEREVIAREQIEKSLEILNEKERHCLILRTEGLSYREIADVLETTVKSVSVYLARGLKKIESQNED